MAVRDRSCSAPPHLGGDFGLSGDIPTQQAMTGSVHGFVKSLAHEWPDVRVRALDLAGRTARRSASRISSQKPRSTDDLVEVGYRADGQRVTTALASAPLAERVPTARELTADSVVLLTGGARGITAEIAAEIAEQARPRLVLVGRTPLAIEEDAATAGVEGMAELKRALIDRARSRGEQVTPPAIERAYHSVLAEREVRGTLDRLQALARPSTTRRATSATPMRSAR